MTDDDYARELVTEAPRLDAEALARELEADVPQADDEAGDLLGEGWHLLRAGRVVRLATWDGQWATEHRTEKDAREGFKRLVAERS